MTRVGHCEFRTHHLEPNLLQAVSDIARSDVVASRPPMQQRIISLVKPFPSSELAFRGSLEALQTLQVRLGRLQ